MDQEEVAVKCIGFGRILYSGGRYLVHENTQRGWLQLFGGGLRCSRNYAQMLQRDLGAKFMSGTRLGAKVKGMDKYDLRLFIPKSELETFTSLYHTSLRAGKKRTVESDCRRELREELVTEEGLLPGNRAGFSLTFRKSVQYVDPTQEPPCHYFWEFSDVTLIKEARDTILQRVRKRNKGDDLSVRLVTREEIERGFADDGLAIADSVKHVLPLE